MSIFVDNDTRVIVQGITGSQGKYHTEQMKVYGTDIVAGAVPGKGGEKIHGVPVFDTVFEAAEQTEANASVIFVPPAAGKDAVFEAIAAQLDPVIVISEGIPQQDMLLIRRRLSETGTRLIGPNTPGIITPGQTKLGIFPNDLTAAGSVGIISRSGTLTYQIVEELNQEGIGQSTVLGVGGDPIIGTTFRDALSAFEADPQTDAVVLCGEIGGEQEEQAAEFIQESMTTPVVGFVAGRTAPAGTRMGHAGAIITSDGTGTAEHKIRLLKRAGADIAHAPKEIPTLLKSVLE